MKDEAFGQAQSLKQEKQKIISLARNQSVNVSRGGQKISFGFYRQDGCCLFSRLRHLGLLLLHVAGGYPGRYHPL